MHKYHFTVFTATFNRSNELIRVYRSLQNQTFKDFEWLIIDDGSTDNTKFVVNQFSLNGDIRIRYYKQPNMHKFYTMLKGIGLADGYFFLPLDSDDECSSNSLELLKKVYDNVPENLRNSIAGVNCLCNDQYGRIVGDKYPSDYLISNNFEIFIKYRIKGEKWGCIKTDILKEYKFDEIYFNNGYIPESLIWYRIAKDNYSNVYINDTLRTYFVDENKSSIMEDGRKNYYKNSFGAIEESKYVLNNSIKYFFYNPIFYVKKMVIYSFFSSVRNINFFKEFSGLKFPVNILYIFFFPMIIIGKIKLKRQQVNIKL